MTVPWIEIFINTRSLITLVNDNLVDNNLKENLVHVYCGSIVNNLPQPPQKKKKKKKKKIRIMEYSTTNISFKNMTETRGGGVEGG